MPKFKELCENFNFLKDCRENHLSFFSCPPVLFIIMGFINIISIIAAYFIGTKYFDEYQIVILVSALSVFILAIGYLIVQSFERIADANRMKTDFLNIATHQLLTPLSSIRWITETLLSEKIDNSPEQANEYLKMIRVSSQRMVKLISDLLDVNRIEEGKIKMNPQSVDLNQATVDIIKEIMPQNEFKEAEVKLEHNGENFLVFIDPVRLRMVIQNLIDNAIKYSISKKDIQIKITNSKGLIKFLIEDKGIGIKKADYERMFQKFSRGRTIKFSTTGTGLGLFIAKFVIEKAGGKIGFDSEENKGSQFWFTLSEYKPD